MIDRTKSFYTEEHNIIIPSNRQFLNITVGERGSGKSATQELLLETLFEKGWTVFDAWSAGFEAMFYCVNLDCKRKREEKISELQHKIRVATLRHQAKEVDTLQDELVKQKTELGCTCFKHYPVTILCNEAIDIDQVSLGRINEICYSKEEWIAMMRERGEVVVEYDIHNPPEKPISERKEWIKIVKLPTPNVKDGTVNNKEILRIFAEALIACRQERRILTYVPALFPSSFSKNRTLGIIIEGLPDVMDANFIPYTEKELGRPKERWTKYERNYHQMCMLLREVGSIAEDGLYGDPNAKFIKRHIQKIVRVSRHHHISILFDLQRLSDFALKIRSQVSSIILKRTPNKLIGEELEYVKEWIEEQQNKMFERYGYSEEVKQYVFDKYPSLKTLNKNYCYTVYSDDYIKKWNIPNTKHHHKQENDSILKMIGFAYTINQDVINSHLDGKSAESVQVDQDEKELYWFIHKLRNPKEGKADSWVNIKNTLTDKQKQGKFKKANDYSKLTHDTIRIWFKRKSKNYENI